MAVSFPQNPQEGDTFTVGNLQFVWNVDKWASATVDYTFDLIPGPAGPEGSTGPAGSTGPVGPEGPGGTFNPDSTFPYLRLSDLTDNVLIGSNANTIDAIGGDNVVIGNDAGSNLFGGDNVIIGARAKPNADTSNIQKSVLIGADVVSDSLTSTQLKIGNADGTWITGDSNFDLQVNGFSATSFASDNLAAKKVELETEIDFELAGLLTIPANTTEVTSRKDQIGTGFASTTAIIKTINLNPSSAPFPNKIDFEVSVTSEGPPTGICDIASLVWYFDTQWRAKVVAYDYNLLTLVDRPVNGSAFTPSYANAQGDAVITYNLTGQELQIIITVSSFGDYFYSTVTTTSSYLPLVI